MDMEIGLVGGWDYPRLECFQIRLTTKLGINLPRNSRTGQIVLSIGDLQTSRHLALLEWKNYNEISVPISQKN
jgi:hypothetical protein